MQLVAISIYKAVWERFFYLLKNTSGDFFLNFSKKLKNKRKYCFQSYFSNTVEQSCVFSFGPILSILDTLDIALPGKM